MEIENNKNITNRIEVHIDNKNFIVEIVKWFDEDSEALSYESLLIKMFKPCCNIKSNPDNEKGVKNVSEKTDTGNTVYGFSISKEHASELRKVCQARYGMPAAQYMRIVAEAIIEDRVIIKKPKDKKEIYND